MKKHLITLIAFIISSSGIAQQAYIAPSAGAYLNTDIKTPLEMIGYGLEAGYCFENNFSVGGSVGSLNLSHTAPFVQARTGYTFLERKHFSLSIGAGLGYVFRVNQLIGEGDLNANIHIKPNWDFTFTFANQGVYGIGYLPAINLGFVK